MTGGTTKDLYTVLGIAANKASVRRVWKDAVNPSVYPQAFCTIARDEWTSEWVMTKHADGSGSKTVTRALYALTVGDFGIFCGEPYDGLSMNTGDIAASGFVISPYVITDTIGINSNTLPKHPILCEIAKGFLQLARLYERYDLKIVFMGGETADVPDQLRTMIFDLDIFARMHKQWVIDGNVEAGDQIFGFRSDGQAVWEDSLNSGHMSNGSTLTRHVLAHADYGRQHPQLFRTEKLPQGRYHLDDFVSGLDMTVGEAMMSPTRQWVIVVKMLIEELKEKDSLCLLHAIVMNTGGGLTKCVNVGSRITYNMDVPEPSPIFRLIQDEANTSWKRMVRDYNCGTGLIAMGSSEGGILQKAIESVSRMSNVQSNVLGTCSQSGDDKNHVAIDMPYGSFYDPHEE